MFVLMDSTSASLYWNACTEKLCLSLESGFQLMLTWKIEMIVKAIEFLLSTWEINLDHDSRLQSQPWGHLESKSAKETQWHQNNQQY